MSLPEGVSAIRKWIALFLSSRLTAFLHELLTSGRDRLLISHAINFYSCCYLILQYYYMFPLPLSLDCYLNALFMFPFVSISISYSVSFHSWSIVIIIVICFEWFSILYFIIIFFRLVNQWMKTAFLLIKIPWLNCNSQSFLSGCRYL